MEDQNNPNKTTVISLVANKGGVGKTRTVILLSRFLAACSYKVCLIDLDDNNSTSYFFLTEKTAPEAKSRNSAKLMQSEDSRLQDFTIPTEYENISIIPADYYLSDLRTVSERRLSRIIASSGCGFDYIIIDCKPAYDNITINAINSSDYILTPALQDFDSYNAAAYLRDKIAMDTSKSDNWFVTINGFNKRFANAITGEQKDYIESYKALPGIHLTPMETWFPWTKDMNRIKDRGMRLSEKKGVKNSVYNPALYESVYQLALCFVDKEELPRPESI